VVAEELTPARDCAVTVAIDRKKCQAGTGSCPRNLFDVSVAVDVEHDAIFSRRHPVIAV
jgi:hypothetical protein